MTKKRKLSRKKKPAPRSLRRLFPNVTHVVDADGPVSVNVKSEDCRRATRLDPRNCALAIAAKREYQADAAVIGISSSYIITGNKAVRYATPESVRREIVSFDRNADFEPGEYHLPPKSPTSRLGVSHRRHRDDGERDRAPIRRKIHHAARVRLLDKISRP